MASSLYDGFSDRGMQATKDAADRDAAKRGREEKQRQKKIAAEAKRLRLLLAERDAFITERGLWPKFIEEFGTHRNYSEEP